MTAADERRAAAAALLRDRSALRIAIQGQSMQPMLRAPMVLEVGPAANARIGDILIFAHGDVSVAHRIVAVESDGYRTAGDAQPTVVERVAPDEIVGRVVAVWSDASTAAHRVDRAGHRLRSWYYGRFRPLRYGLARLRERIAYVVERAQPWRRARTTLLLIDALTAAEAGDSAELAGAIAAGGNDVCSSATRHRCLVMLGEAARHQGIVDRIRPDVVTAMRQARLDAAIATTRFHRAVDNVVRALQQTGVRFALLKGAARVFAAAPDASWHASDDIDVFVDRADLDAAFAAMLANGYRTKADAVEIRRYRSHHHHAAPLYPPGGEFPVELHHALARPVTLSTATDWTAFEQYLAPIPDPLGTVSCLNATGTALHLAIHAIGLKRLRDVALLARVLRTLDDETMQELHAVIRAERQDPIRLEASVLLAARIAGVPWDAGAAVDRYLQWALLREDLPAFLRGRCEAVEAYFAHPRSVLRVLAGLVPRWSSSLGMPARISGRCITNPAALL